jgi:uncharacterized OB-fold protein
MKLTLNGIMEYYRSHFDRGVLCFIRCDDCSNVFYYPRDGCPRCGSVSLTLCESSGRGTVFSYTKVHRKGVPDAVYAIVELDEGFRLYTNIENSEPSVGSHVEVFMRETNRGKMPFFRMIKDSPDPQ